MMGASRPDEGLVQISGKTIRLKNTSDAARAGLGIAPEDRKRDGVLHGRSIRDNILLRRYWDVTRWGFVVRQGLAREIADDYVRRLKIKALNSAALAGKLSGGNQQKVVLARLLAGGADVLLFDEPTRGSDGGAKREGYGTIHALANEGKAVLVVTSELDEALSIADRLVVMREGRLSVELDPSSVSREAVLDLAFPATESA